MEANIVASIQAGESSEQAALRELEEEIGLSGPVVHVADFFFEHEFKVHVSLFVKAFDRSRDLIRLNPAEVMDGRFYSLDEIETLDHSCFHPQLVPCLERIREYIDLNRGE